MRKILIGLMLCTANCATPYYTGVGSGRDVYIENASKVEQEFRDELHSRERKQNEQDDEVVRRVRQTPVVK